MRDSEETRERGRERQSEASERYLWPGCHGVRVTRHQPALQASLRLSPRWLQMAALQTLDCRLGPPVVWVTAVLQTGGPMGARVSGLTGQWEVGRCKGWHPSVQPVLQIQNTDRGNLQQSLGVQSLVCRHPGSITDHNQPLFLARGGSTHSGHCPRPSLSGQNLCSEK